MQSNYLRRFDQHRDHHKGMEISHQSHPSPESYLLVRLFEVFHEDRDDDVNEDELRHEDKDDEK